MDPLIGKSFGAYKVEARIGQGGMAVVYRGYQESLNRYVAIKVLRSDLARDQTFIARFRREALAVAKLSHPNILHVYDAGAAHGVYYIVMDYAPGGSLQDLLGRGPVAPEVAVSMVSQVADALDYAHRNDLVHRDVKPSNILMGQDGRPKLTDFGIAKMLYGETHLTQTGASIGTPAYMAPEQAEGLDTDGRTDIYALGIVLYELLTGRVPFSAATPMAVLYKQLHSPPPPLRQVNPSIPGWLEAVANMALAKRPEARFQKASAFATALRQGTAPRATSTPIPVPAGAGVAQGVPAAETHAAEQAADRMPIERRPGRNIVPILLGVIVVVVLALGAGAAYLVWGGGSKDGNDATAGSTIVVTQAVVTRVVTAGAGGQITRVVTPSGQGQATEAIPGAQPTEEGAGVSQLPSPTDTTIPTQAPDAPTPTATATTEPPTMTPVPTSTPSRQPTATLTHTPRPTATAQPPSRRLLFVSNEVSEDDLFTVDEDGKDRKRLTTMGKIGAAAYSPDGKKIVFSRTVTDDPYNADIYVMKSDGTEVVNTTNTADFVEFDPDWSADGTRIVFRGRPASETYSKVWIMNADGSGRRLLTDANNSDRSPVWSPTGGRIAFVGYWEGGGGYWQDRGDIFVINADGTGLANWTNRGEGFSSPVWSPNGQELIYGRLTRDPGTGEYWQIWRMGAGGANQRCIIGCTGEFATWSNVPTAWKGSKLLFSGWEAGDWDLFIANADGTNPVQLTSKSADEKARDWQP